MICHNCQYVFVPNPLDIHFGVGVCRRCSCVVPQQRPGWHDIRDWKHDHRCRLSDEQLDDFVKLIQRS
jgi:hypothetical protein